MFMFMGEALEWITQALDLLQVLFIATS